MDVVLFVILTTKIFRMPTNTPRSHIYFSQRLRLHYVTWGNEGAPPVLLIHGGHDHCRNWDWVAQSLQKDYFVVAPDLRGHGDSQWLVGSPYSMVDFLYDIEQLVHQLGYKQISVIGHSLGGMIALLYAGLYSEKVNRALSIEGMAGYNLRFDRAPEQIRSRMRNWIESTRGLASRTPRRYPTIAEAFQRMQSVNSYLTTEQARHLTIHGSNQNENGTYSWKFDNYTRVFGPVRLANEEIEYLYSQIDCPVLLVYGKDSWAGAPPKDKFSASIPNFQTAAIGDAGHWCHHDHLDEFLAIANKFLQT